MYVVVAEDSVWGCSKLEVRLVGEAVGRSNQEKKGMRKRALVTS
jgi:hypothetical protein